MPSPLRKSKKVWILTKREGEIETVVCVTPTFRTAYKLALFELKIAKPCLTELQARRLYHKLGKCLIWNTLEFESFEEALWSPIGRLAKLQQVPVKRA
ncbi:MAG TPA: hypothetical protein HA367_06510 [Candidatus Methanofastidiosum sp.]|jgi:hypothetical protein|nr:hypothetical protein [Methanofastidiosum sp.]